MNDIRRTILWVIFGFSMVMLVGPVDMADPQKSTVLLDESKDRFYVAQTGLIGGAFPTHKTPMTVTGERVLKDGVNELVIKFESADLGGVKLVKTYTLQAAVPTTWV
jgi:YidC/Oxa1 family membrane protein insertase